MKIFDSIMVRLMTIFLKPPDIIRYILNECFIDFKDFKNFEELDKFLRSIDEKTYNKYIEAINDFIISDQYREYFGHEKYVKDMIEIFKSY